MIVTAYFSEDGLPKTGLSPTIDIIDTSDDSVDVNDGAMSEVAQGFYKYDFSTYDSSKNYLMIADSVTLTADERYAIGSLEVGTSHLLKTIENKKELKKNGAVWELIIYDDDGTTPILNKEIKDSDGNDITDLAAGTLAQELANSV